MIGTTKLLNRMHLAASCGSKCQRSTLPLSCASLRAPEGDVTLRDVMNVEYFSYPSTGSSFPIRGTCASRRRPARQPNPSRAVLPQGWRKTPGSLAFWLWWPRCRCCGCRRWARLTLPLGGQYGPDVYWTQPERWAIRRVLYVVVLACEILEKPHH